SASFLYQLLRSVRAVVLPSVFALLLSWAVIFLIPGWPPWLTGPSTYPSVGAFRFFWCYALLAVLFWEHRRQERHPVGRWPLWLGCCVWLVGTLWSGESAVYCLTI